MPNFPSRSDLFRRGQNEVLAKQALLSLASVQRDGSDSNVLLAAGSAMSDMTMLALVQAWNALFFSTAQGSDLDRLALDRYGLVRKPASAAIGTVVFSSPNYPSATFQIPAGTVLGSASGVQFQTTATAVWLAANLSTDPVPVASTLAGSNQQAQIGTINSITAPITGTPVATVVTNTVATAGAADAETDPAFRARCVAFPQIALQGTLVALTQGALSVPGVVLASAFESLNTTGEQTGYVNVVVADAFTDVLAQLNQNPPAYQTQSQQLALAVAQALNNVRAAGVYVQVLVAQSIIQTVQLALSFQANADSLPGGVEQVAFNARVAAFNYVNSLNPGQTFDPVACASLVVTTNGLSGAVVVVPSGQVIPTSLQVLRASLGSVTGFLNTGAPVSSVTSPDALGLA